MTFSHIQQQNAYRKLPPEVQDLIMNNETTDAVTSALKEIGLDDRQLNFADSEILYAMYCLQSLDDAINNIAKLSGKSVSELSNLKSTLQENIFSKYKIDIDDFIEANKSQSTASAQPVQKTKDEIKEELIRRREGVSSGARISNNLPQIAPDLDPMIVPGEVAREIPHVEQHAPQPAPQPAPETGMTELEKDSPIVGANFVPASAPAQSPQPPKPQTTLSSPTEPQPAQTQSPDAPTLEDRRYPGGVDPYREPIS